MPLPSLAEMERLFPEYAHFQRLGEGGMGAVYGVYDPSLGLDIALKVSPVAQGEHADALRQRFQREFAILREASVHKHLVRVLRAGERRWDAEPGVSLLWYTMERCAASVQGVLKQLTLEQRVLVVSQLLDALAWLEAMKIAHRDLKPANIFLTWDRGRPHIRLGDFGIARGYGRNDGFDLTLTQEGFIHGTLEYFAPEIHRGDEEIHPFLSDQWAAGLIIYELVSQGLKAYDFEGALRSRRHPFYAYGEAKQLPPRKLFIRDFLVPPDNIQRHIFRMLSPDPRDRFPNMKQCRSAFHTAFLQIGMLSTSSVQG